MLFVNNDDKPGFIGKLGSVLGANAINIATFHLGRKTAGDEAIEAHVRWLLERRASGQ